MYEEIPEFADKTAPSSNQTDRLVLELARSLDVQVAKSTITDWYLLRLRSAVGDYRRAKGLQ